MSHVNHPGDLVLLEEIARHTDVGYLGIITPDTSPRAVPVNFALIGDRLYFQGASSSGGKFDAIAAGQEVTVCIAVP